MNWTLYKKLNIEKYIDENGNYKVGSFIFKTKDDIIKFNRTLLDNLNIGEVTEFHFIKFALHLFNNHPSETKENKQYIFDNFESVYIQIAEFDSTNLYTVFVIKYMKDGILTNREFSSNKCIKSIKKINSK